MAVIGSILQKLTYATDDGGMTWTEVATERLDDEDYENGVATRQERRFRGNVDYENGVVIVEGRDADGQWTECGRLPRSYSLQPEPLLSGARR